MPLNTTDMFIKDCTCTKQNNCKCERRPNPNYRRAKTVAKKAVKNDGFTTLVGCSKVACDQEFKEYTDSEDEVDEISYDSDGEPKGLKKPKGTVKK